MNRDGVMSRLEQVEHPEIAATPLELGVLMDLALDGDVARVAIALPMMNIPATVRDHMVNSLRGPLEDMGFTMETIFFEMMPDVRERFFQISKARWKGSILSFIFGDESGACRTQDLQRIIKSSGGPCKLPDQTSRGESCIFETN